MFYTNRRANDTSLEGITWVHGSKIGVATSKNGAHWTYYDYCNIEYEKKKMLLIGLQMLLGIKTLFTYT